VVGAHVRAILAGVRIQLGIGHPGQAPTQVLTLADEGTGRYRTQARLPHDGAWLATLYLDTRAGRIVLEHALDGE